MLIFAIDCWRELIVSDHILALELPTAGLTCSPKSTRVFLRALNLKLHHSAHPSLPVPCGVSPRRDAEMLLVWLMPGPALGSAVPGNSCG